MLVFISLKHGFYLFKFKSYEVSQKILEEGLWFFSGSSFDSQKVV